MLKTPLMLVVCLASPSPAATLQEEAAQFVKDYAPIYQAVYTVSGNADWDAATDVSPEHDGARIAANKALAAVTGNARVIERCKRFLAKKETLDPLLVRQLERMLLSAAENPGTLPDVTARRVELEARQSSAMDSFQFCLEKKDGRCVSPATANDIDDRLVKETDLAKRRAVWEASKEIGPVLKPGLVELQGLRNSVAAHFGYPSYFDLQTANMSMSADELVALMDGLLKDIQPLYEQLHCYAKYALAERYKQPVPAKTIPAHWIANRWAQEWSGLAEGVDLDPYFKGKSAEWMVQQGEGFWTSLGFPRLPESFWRRSDLYALPKDSKRKKNTHASAWHVDLEQDYRSLQNVEPNVYWWNTVHHELGHIYYYVNYSTPSVPVLLRTGATRAFHEGVAEFGGLASSREAYLRRVGLLPPGKTLDQDQWLLNQAFVETVAFLPWAAGTMTAWERDVYAKKLPPSQWNARWWEYVRKYQGVEPPSPRGEEHCDACTKTHVNDNPVYYYNYAVATILKYQLYAHICRDILRQDMQSCDPYGKPEVGAFLKKVLSAGATKDWRVLLKETTGQELSTKPMMEYFQPLVGLLEKANQGRQCGWQ
jgi:peptidyl-dipeptidase A